MTAVSIVLRQHWASVLARNGLAAFCLIGAAAVYLFFKLSPVLPRAIRIPMLSELHWLNVWLVPVFVLIVGLLVVVNVSVWQLSRLSVGGGVVTWAFGPVAENRIPLSAIQDLRVSRSAFGMLLGYGTLVLASGRTTETLPFIPDPQDVADAILRAR